MSPPDPSSRALVVLVDDAPMEATAARAFWERFSAWMEEHRGDLAGFAQKEGFASVHPGVEGGRPVLRVSKDLPQQPYEGGGGSANRQRRENGPDLRGHRRRGKPGKARGKNTT